MKTKNIKYGVKSHDERFGTEEQCRDYLVKLRWDGRPTCQKCGNKHMNYYLTSRNIWKCSKCKNQFSVIKGTIFESSKLPLTTWFKAIYYFVTKKRGLSSCQLAEWLEVEQRTAWFMLHRLREVINEENDIVLSGVVEADETSIGPSIKRDSRLHWAKKTHDKRQEKIHGMTKSKKRRIKGEPAKRGRKKGSTKEVLAQKRKEKEKLAERIPFEQDIMILGMTERGGKVVLKLIGRSLKSLTTDNIHPKLKSHINSSSILFTDQSNVYDATETMFREHHSVNHSNYEYVRGTIYTNTIENVWKHFKKVIDGTYFHMSYQHFERYLNEHSFRWNRRNVSNLEKVNSFFDTIQGKRLKYKDLIRLPKNPYKIAA